MSKIQELEEKYEGEGMELPYLVEIILSERSEEAAKEYLELANGVFVANDRLSNLLAVIHRDGGQYEDEQGTSEAVRVGMKKVSYLLCLSDEWVARFGFLATNYPAHYIESVDEVACLLNLSRYGKKDTPRDALFLAVMILSVVVVALSGICTYLVLR